MEPNNTSSTAPKKTNGALIGSIIIILILIIGGIYLLGRSQGEEAPMDIEAGADYLSDENLSESDDLQSIEADLNAQGEFEYADEGLE